MDRAKVSQLFKKQIPPGQHNCNERDMTKNMKSLNLVPSQTVMSSEELWVSLPGQCSHCCSHAQSTAPYSLPHKTVLKMNNMILANSLIHQSSHTNAKCQLTTHYRNTFTEGVNLACSGCPHCGISPIYFIIFLQSYSQQAA